MARPRLQFPNRDEERILLERAAQGDQRARDAIILNHQPIAYKIAAKFRRYGLPIEDLRQEAFAGLLVALDKFDLNAGVRFNTYAQWWVKARLAEYVLYNASAVRSPTHTEGKRAFFNGEYRCVAIPLDRSIYDDASPFVEFFASEDAGPDENAERAIDDAHVRAALDKLHLSARERAILNNRILADEPNTLEALAGVFGLSKERVRQVEGRLRRMIAQAVLA